MLTNKIHIALLLCNSKYFSAIEVFTDPKKLHLRSLALSRHPILKNTSEKYASGLRGSTFQNATPPPRAPQSNKGGNVIW